jgi:hypothetical protein
VRVTLHGARHSLAPAIRPRGRQMQDYAWKSKNQSMQLPARRNVRKICATKFTPANGVASRRVCLEILHQNMRLSARRNVHKLCSSNFTPDDGVASRRVCLEILHQIMQLPARRNVHDWQSSAKPQSLGNA